MLAVVTTDNLGLLWAAIEATTLASALLVGFYRTRAALEAAWKYLILCTVGITVRALRRAADLLRRRRAGARAGRRGALRGAR